MVAGGDFEWSNGFDNLRAKIGRAYTHLQEFDSLAAAYTRENRYRVTTHDDVANQRYVVTYEFFIVRSEIHLILADMIYSLRSGLDQLAWQLALLGNPSPDRDVMFPIFSDQSSKSKERFDKIVCDMPIGAIIAIKDLQPYKRGASYRDDPLWQLNELSNLDKHRLPMGRATVGSFYLEPVGFTRRDLDYGIEFSWPLSVKESVVFQPDPPVLLFGDPINSNRNVPLELSRFEIAKIYSYVREVVAPRFTSFFSAPPYP